MSAGRLTRRGVILAGVAVVAPCTASFAQTNPRIVLFQLIDELQTGTSNAVNCSPEVREVIRVQTGGSKTYPALQRLGKVSTISIQTTIPMARGITYSLVAVHARGKSSWQLGVSSATRSVEYIEFKIEGGTGPESTVSIRPGYTSPPPAPSPGPPSSAPSPPLTPAPPVQSPADEACRKFPNLC